MILDEPTAHLDPEARAALTADLLVLTAGRATLLITHELAGLDQVDEIIVLDHGKVAQRGPHEQLIQADGPYRQLHETLVPGAGVTGRGDARAAGHQLQGEDSGRGLVR
jgi:ABC-type multidrug transport system fused ATPase/permease subunit